MPGPGSWKLTPHAANSGQCVVSHADGSSFTFNEPVGSFATRLNCWPNGDRGETPITVADINGVPRTLTPSNVSTIN
jgi:hypothetical protein